MRPYLVIPKLIEQPTWGGTYIVETKQWQSKPELHAKKIGQSYELYNKSNLSLITDSRDKEFLGELEDNKSVETQSEVDHAVPIATLISKDPNAVLGKRIVDTYGAVMPLLLKFTQALGNSFQLHIPDGMTHPKWKAKPESWYYFEPGLITCGVKAGTDWDAYERAIRLLDADIRRIAEGVKTDPGTYDQAKIAIDAVIKQLNPLQYVNLVRVEKGTLIDLSPCGIHHSWEEDLDAIPLGNVLYEIQLNRMDDEATIRNFDKGKMKPDGTLRTLQIDDYFAYIDRSKDANNPNTHLRTARVISETDMYRHDSILDTKYYQLDRILFAEADAGFVSTIETFRHIFVKSGSAELDGGDVQLTLTRGHSAFIPAAVGKMDIRALEASTEILVSY